MARPKIGRDVLPTGLRVEWHPNEDVLPVHMQYWGGIHITVGIGEPPRPKRRQGRRKSRAAVIEHRMIAHEVVRLERALMDKYGMTAADATATAMRAVADSIPRTEKTVRTALEAHRAEAEQEQEGYIAALGRLVSGN